VSLVTRSLGRCEAAGSHETGQNLELFDKFIVKDTPGLIACERLMPVGRFSERIPAHEDGTRAFGLVEPKEQIGEAEGRAAALITSSANSFGQRVIRAVGKGIAINHQKRASQRWVSFSWTTSSARLSSRRPR